MLFLLKSKSHRLIASAETMSYQYRRLFRRVIMLNRQFIPIIFLGVLSLLVIFSTTPIDTHIVVRLLMCVAALIPILMNWSALKIFDKIILVATVVIYNPMYLIQLGSALAWGSLGLFLVIYFAFRLVGTRRNSVDSNEI